MDVLEFVEIPEYTGRPLGDVLAENTNNGIIFKIGADKGSGFIYAAPITNKTKDWFDSWTIRRLQHLLDSINNLRSKEKSKTQYAKYKVYYRGDPKKRSSFKKWSAGHTARRERLEQRFNKLSIGDILDSVVTDACWSTAYPNTIILHYKGADLGEYWTDTEFYKKWPEFKKEVSA